MLPFELTKDTPYLALSGELWSVFYEYFNRNWSCYKGFLLYFDSHHNVLSYDTIWLNLILIFAKALIACWATYNFQHTIRAYVQNDLEFKVMSRSREPYFSGYMICIHHPKFHSDTFDVKANMHTLLFVKHKNVSPLRQLFCIYTPLACRYRIIPTAHDAIITTSKRRRDVVFSSLWRYYCVLSPLGYFQSYSHISQGNTSYGALPRANEITCGAFNRPRRVHKSQRAHDAITTSLLRQNDVATSFWHNSNDVIISSWVRWDTATCVMQVSSTINDSEHMTKVVWPYLVANCKYTTGDEIARHIAALQAWEPYLVITKAIGVVGSHVGSSGTQKRCNSLTLRDVALTLNV